MLGWSRALVTARAKILEAPRYASARRNAFLADPAFFDVPLPACC